MNFDACKSAVGWGKSIGSALNSKLGTKDDAKSGIEDVIKIRQVRSLVMRVIFKLSLTVDHRGNVQTPLRRMLKSWKREVSKAHFYIKFSRQCQFFKFRCPR